MPAARRIVSSLAAAGVLSLAVTSSAAASGHVYLTAVNGLLRAYDVTASGTLVPNLSPSAPVGAGPRGFAISPDGRHAYVANNSSNTVSVLDIAATGALSPNGPPVATSAQPEQVAVSPDGNHVYVSTYDPSNPFSDPDPILVFDVGPTGALTPNASPTAPAADGPVAIAVSPNGAHVYAANTGIGSISVFDVSPSGSLTPSSTTAVSPGSSLAISPDGARLYTTDGNGTEIQIFDVGPTGALTANAASPVALPAGASSFDVTMSPDGRRLFVPLDLVSTVAAYDVGPTGGLTLASTPTAAGDGPFAIAVAPGGADIYVASYSFANPNDRLRAMDVSSTGVVTQNGPALGVGGSHARWLAHSPAQPPVAAFTPTAASSGAATAFDGSASSDPDGTVARYDWDFGDGQTLPNGGPAPTHVYAAPGDYTVSLTVADDESCSTQPRYNGQMMSCNGKPTARTTRTITVPAVGPDLAAWLALLNRSPTTAPDAGATPAAVPAAGPKAPATPRRCVVPRLRGRTHGDARRALIRAGCRITVRGKARAGRVVWQSRRAGTKLERGSRVTVVLRRRR